MDLPDKDEGAPRGRARGRGSRARAARPRQSAHTKKSTDYRYGTHRWKRTRLAVIRRDLGICRIVAGCPTPANVADHITPVYPGMPDSLFFDMRNLRAACRQHNLARGHAATLEASDGVG